MPSTALDRTPLVVGGAAVATLAVALWTAAATGLTPALGITAVANVFLASRTMAGLPPRRRFAELPVVAVLIVVATAFGHVLLAVPWLGSLLFAVAVAASVWARRFGPRGRRLGRLAAAPFVSVLIVPVPAAAAGGRGAFVVPLVAVAGQAITALVLTIARVRPEPVTPASVARSDAPAVRSSPRRIASSTRQAAQMLVALLAAFVVGFVVFGRHWPWVVITVYVVQIGARGRGDALVKAAERLLGAVGGTVVGMLVAAVPLPNPVRVGIILVVLTTASALRARSYLWWAAGLTTALALLYDVLGVGGVGSLLPRIAAVVVGGAIAVLASWFVLPIRTRDVLRRRVADHLAAVQEVLRARRDAPGDVPAALAGVEDAATRLSEVERTHRLHARVNATLRRPAPPGAAAVAALQRVDVELRHVVGTDPLPAGWGAVQRQVGALRRLIGRRPDVDRAPVPPSGALSELGAALDDLWDPVERLNR